MAAMPADAAPPIDRVDFIKCQTPACRHNLGVKMPGGRIYWHVPVIVNFVDRSTEITCPVCQAQRTWTNDKPR